MTFMRKLTLLALILAAGATACRSSDGDDAVTPDGNGNVDPNDVTIQQIQDPAMANGTAVKLKGVVVTAIDKYGMKTGDIWVEEPGGGEFSGIHVFGAPLDQVNALSPGDVVDIDGAQKDDFHYNGNMGSGGFPDGYAITELKPVTGGTMSVTATGATMTITPDVVDALPIGQMTDYMARDAEWEKWEGVLITVKNVSAFSSDACVGSACNDATLRKFDITGGIVVESALSAMPSTAVKSGDCMSSITGVVDYFFDYQLLPRTTDEIATGGSACPTEKDATTCGDGIDNDGNGFKDCEDFGCQANVASCVMHPTIEQVRTGQVTGTVSLEDVYVSAVSLNRKNFWISQSLTATANQGVYVFRCSSTNACNAIADLDAGVVPGAKVTVLGKVAEFNNGNPSFGSVTQITQPTITVTAAPTGTVTPVSGQTVTNLLAAGTGEPYEGVLVSLSNVQVTTVGRGTTFGVSDLTQYPGAVAFKADDDIFKFVAGDASACYASITGIWTYTPFDKRYQFLPTGVGTGTGTCQ